MRHEQQSDSGGRRTFYVPPTSSAGDACATAATDTGSGLGLATYLHSYCVPGADPQRTEAFDAPGTDRNRDGFDALVFTADDGRRTVIQADYAYGAEDSGGSDTIAFFAWLLLVAVGGFIGLAVISLALLICGTVFLVRWIRHTAPDEKGEDVKRLASNLETVLIILMVPVLVVTGAHAAVAVAFPPHEWCSGTSPDGSYAFTATTRTVNRIQHTEAPVEFVVTTFDDAGNPTGTTTVKTTIPSTATGCKTDLTAGHAYINATIGDEYTTWSNSEYGLSGEQPHVLALRWDL